VPSARQNGAPAGHETQHIVDLGTLESGMVAARQIKVGAQNAERF